MQDVGFFYCKKLLTTHFVYFKWNSSNYLFKHVHVSAMAPLSGRLVKVLPSNTPTLEGGQASAGLKRGFEGEFLKAQLRWEV